MTTIVRAKSSEMGWRVAAWLPEGVLPVVVAVVSADWPAWVRMWVLAISIFGGFKWLTFCESSAARRASFWRAAGYLFLWTGMDAEAFFGGDGGQGTEDREGQTAGRAGTTRWSEWVWAVGQTAVGVWMLVWLAPRFVVSQPLVAGWLGMVGVVSILHFGVSQLLSLLWRRAGVNARHIMHKPLWAKSLADFWGRRWNLAFRDLAHRFVFQPLVGNVGVASATMAVFLASGLIHDAVISFSAGGGWGLPTVYFLIQGVAVLFERSRFGKWMGLGRGVVGWLFAAAVVVGPVGLLFHTPFVTRVIVPMVEAVSW